MYISNHSGSTASALTWVNSKDNKYWKEKSLILPDTELIQNSKLCHWIWHSHTHKPCIKQFIWTEEMTQRSRALRLFQSTWLPFPAPTPRGSQPPGTLWLQEILCPLLEFSGIYTPGTQRHKHKAYTQNKKIKI